MTRRPFILRLDVQTVATENLLAIAEFFDSDQLRASFSSLLTEVRAELLVRARSPRDDPFRPNRCARYFEGCVCDGCRGVDVEQIARRDSTP
jgi:hypothetical protein